MTTPKDIGWGRIRIDTEHVREVSQRLIVEGGRLAEIGHELQRAIGSLDVGSWDGASRTQAEPMLSRVRPESARLARQLEHLGYSLARVAEVFEHEDNNAAGRLEGMPWVDWRTGSGVTPLIGSEYLTPEQEQEAQDIINQLSDDYDVHVTVDREVWFLEELRVLRSGVLALATAMGGAAAFRQNLGYVQVHRSDTDNTDVFMPPGTAFRTDGVSTDEWSVVRQMARVWDAKSYELLSQDMQEAAEVRFGHPTFDMDPLHDPAHWCDPNEGSPLCRPDQDFDERDDFAESVAAYVYPDEARLRAGSTPGPLYAHFHDTPRGRYIHTLMAAGQEG